MEAPLVALASLRERLTCAPILSAAARQQIKMKTSQKGAAFIAAREGIVTRAYRDVAGTWTIGVGHTAAAGPPRPLRGMTISRAEAFAILRRDLRKYERRVAASLPGVSQTVFDGAVSFDFNTGAIDRASWVKAFRAGDRADARRRLMLWTGAGGRAVAGLMHRRTAEAKLIFDGDYGEAVATPPAPVVADDVARGLLRLGFSGADAVVRYQRSHPDLVVDGIAGPATRASIARDLAARRGVVAGAVAVVVGAGTAVAGVSAWAAAIVIAAVLIAAGVFAWRYRDELARVFTGIRRRSP